MLDELNDVIAVAITYLTMALLGAGGPFIIQWMFSQCPEYSVPPSLYWFALGIFMSLLTLLIGKCDTEHCKLEDKNYFIYGFYHYFVNVDSHVVYLVLLPPLLYEGALGTNEFKFKALFASSFFLATIGVVITAGVLGALFAVTLPHAFDNGFEPYLMGATMASTDPVAVISVLKVLGFPEKLMTYFEGESLLNDGTSVVMFHILKELAAGDKLTGLDIFGQLCYLAIGSPLFGFVYAMVTASISRFFSHENHTFEAIMFTVHCSMCFVVSEVYLELSGPLCSVCYGLYINFYGFRAIDRRSYHSHHEFVVNIATICEMLIFELSGAIVTFLCLNHHTEIGPVIADGVLVWFFMLVVRLDMFAMMPVLNWFGPYRVNWKEVLLIWWGGLRGAIVLALAHMLFEDPHLSDKFKAEGPVRISIAVGINLLVQGQFFSVVVRFLNPYPPNIYQRNSAEHSFIKIDKSFHGEMVNRFKEAGLTIPVTYDVGTHALKGCMTIRAHDFMTPPKSVVEGALHEGPGGKITALGDDPDKHDDSDDSDMDIFKVKTTDLNVPMKHYLESLGECQKFEYGLGLRLFMPQYISVTTSPSDMINLEDGEMHEEAFEDWKKHGDEHNHPDLIDAILGGIPQAANLHVDGRGNHKFKRVHRKGLFKIVEEWVDHCKYMTFQSSDTQEAQRRFEHEIDEPVRPAAYKNKELTGKKIDTMYLRDIEKSIVISNLCVKSIEKKYTRGAINNSTYAQLHQNLEKCILHFEIEMEKFKILDETKDEDYSSHLENMRPQFLPLISWQKLKPNLNTMRLIKSKNWSKKKYDGTSNDKVSKYIRTWLYRQCLCDIESILGFIDLHERTFINRFHSIQHTLGKFHGLYKTYNDVINEAVDMLLECMNQYGDIFHSAFFIFLGRIVAREKIAYVEAECTKGHISEKAAHKIIMTLETEITQMQEYIDFARKMENFHGHEADMTNDHLRYRGTFKPVDGGQNINQTPHPDPKTPDDEYYYYEL